MNTYTRTQALELLHKHVSNPRMIAHSLASEAVMRALAIKLDRDEEKWGIAGLLHDIDIDICDNDMCRHANIGADMLLELGFDPEIAEAIRMHNESAVNRTRTTEFEHALAAGETITGLIFATAYVYPEKKISVVKAKSIMKRIKEKAFAASVRRESILECELIGIPMADFAQLSIDALVPIEEELGF
jgi:putative nucleotidyltransferase with HDIG domain